MHKARLTAFLMSFCNYGLQEKEAMVFQGNVHCHGFCDLGVWQLWHEITPSAGLSRIFSQVVKAQPESTCHSGQVPMGQGTYTYRSNNRERRGTVWVVSAHKTISPPLSSQPIEDGSTSHKASPKTSHRKKQPSKLPQTILHQWVPSHLDCQDGHGIHTDTYVQLVSKMQAWALNQHSRCQTTRLCESR